MSAWNRPPKTEHLPADRRIWFVSDLHLGRGKNSHTGRYFELEAFFYDEDFRGFCQWLVDDAHKRNASLRLATGQWATKVTGLLPCV